MEACQIDGHIECLKYAHVEDELPNEKTVLKAKNGHIECLKYAHTRKRVSTLG